MDGHQADAACKSPRRLTRIGVQLGPTSVSVFTFSMNGYGRYSRSALHADDGSQATPIHTQGHEERDTKLQYLGFISRYEETAKEKEAAETYRLVTTTEDTFLAFVKRWDVPPYFLSDQIDLPEWSHGPIASFPIWPANDLPSPLRDCADSASLPIGRL
jgi:hypothetical protein